MANRQSRAVNFRQFKRCVAERVLKDGKSVESVSKHYKVSEKDILNWLRYYAHGKLGVRHSYEKRLELMQIALARAAEVDVSSNAGGYEHMDAQVWKNRRREFAAKKAEKMDEVDKESA